MITMLQCLIIGKKDEDDKMIKLLLTIALMTSPAYAIKITNVWAKAPRPGPNGAIFMQIANDGDKDDAVIGASAKVAKSVELHTHIKEGDIYRMREIDKIPLQSHSTTELKPGGLHIMLMGLHEPLKQGDEFELLIKLESGEKITLTVPVKSLEACGCNK